MEDSTPQNQPPQIRGKWVVLTMLIIGLIGGATLASMMPRSNPSEADEGSPYYSRPTDAQIKLLKERHKDEWPKQN